MLAQAKENGGDVERCSLTIVPTISGENYFRDSIGSWWRLYDFVEGTITREVVEEPNDFYTCAKAFGEFLCMLEDFDAKELYEVFPTSITPRRDTRILWRR
jgi:hypothetical protein